MVMDMLRPSLWDVWNNLGQTMPPDRFTDPYSEPFLHSWLRHAFYSGIRNLTVLHSVFPTVTTSIAGFVVSNSPELQRIQLFDAVWGDAAIVESISFTVRSAAQHSDYITLRKCSINHSNGSCSSSALFDLLPIEIFRAQQIKQALPDSAPTQCHLFSSSKLRFGVVRLRPKITDTVKGKLILGAKLLQAGGVEKVFNKKFSAKEGEKLLKASQCYLSTTSGPISGLLFVSTHKLACLSERSIKIPSSTGKSMRMHYKVSIPIAKIKGANESENMENPSEKYIQVVTKDQIILSSGLCGSYITKET
nr:GEM-like protein 4 [Ipomoea batatas]